MSATLRGMRAQLEHAARIAQQIPVGPGNDYISSALEEVISEVSKGVDSLLRQHATRQQLSQAQLEAAYASAPTASAATQPHASLPQRRRLPTPPPPPAQDPPDVRANDIYGYDPNGDLRCRVCFNQGVPCYATAEHIASKRHRQRAQNPGGYNYGWPWKTKRQGLLQQGSPVLTDQ